KFDHTAPDTSIDSKPASVTGSGNASFNFSSPEKNVTFECVLDGSDTAFAPCSSGKSYSGLSHGAHTFRVRAKDPGGNYDPAPASYTWTVDIQPPDTTFTSKPGSQTNSTSAHFV